MYFSSYKNPNIKEINPTLLWEYNLVDFDYQAMRKQVIQRVIERGWPDDFQAIFNIYGIDNVIETIKEIKYLNKKDMNFVHIVFHIPLINLRCYRESLLKVQHWNY
ncbi:MAG: hypothetical protein EAZ15_09135 [Sphingobacteriales bacterium]|nr:MAG: hypothetical protein EAZ15_09135 [Sphingobacteriales bacterium]